MDNRTIHKSLLEAVSEVVEEKQDDWKRYRPMASGIISDFKARRYALASKMANDFMKEVNLFISRFEKMARGKFIDIDGHRGHFIRIKSIESMGGGTNSLNFWAQKNVESVFRYLLNPDTTKVLVEFQDEFSLKPVSEWVEIFRLDNIFTSYSG